MVQPRRAADTVAYVLATDRTPNVSFGYDQVRLGTYRETKSFTIYNTGNKDITYTLTAGGIVTLSRTEVTVKAHSSRIIDATASLSASQLAASRFASQSITGGTDSGSLLSYGGVITANPKNNGTGRYTLRVPWRAVPRAASNIVPSAKSAYTSAGGTSSATIHLGQQRHAHVLRGRVRVGPLGSEGPAQRGYGHERHPRGGTPGPPGRVPHRGPRRRRSGADLRDQHLRPLVGRPPERLHDLDLRGRPGSRVLRIGIDFGLATAGDLSGEPVSFVVDADDNIVDIWGVDAPANGSTILLPALASDISRTDADSTVDYEVLGENLSDSRTRPTRSRTRSTDGPRCPSSIRPSPTATSSGSTPVAATPSTSR